MTANIDDQADDGGQHRQQGVPDDRRDAAAVGRHPADRVADRLAAVEAERQPLQVAEQVRRQVVDHPLAEGDVRTGARQAQRPAEQEQDDRRGDAPGSRPSGVRRAGQQTDRAGQPGRHRLAVEHVVHQDLHRPRLEHVQADLAAAWWPARPSSAGHRRRRVAQRPTGRAGPCRRSVSSASVRTRVHLASPSPRPARRTGAGSSRA